MRGQRSAKRLEKISMETKEKTISELILVEILARLPLRSIARFKSVCRQWKSVIESSYFRSLFISLHKNSSSSWSLMFSTAYEQPITEAIGFYECKTWDLPKSLGSYIFTSLPNPDLSAFDHIYVASSNGLIWIEISEGDIQKSLVGNPVLQQWVEITLPPPEPSVVTGLVTRLENGVVSSFKLVRTCVRSDHRDVGMNVWRVYVYSSDTGLWASKRLISSYPFANASFESPLNLDGMLYLWGNALNPSEPGVLLAHDFSGPEDDDQFRVIPLPVVYNKEARRCLTTSGGEVFYIDMLCRKLKVWRLNNRDSEGREQWQLSQEEINLTSVGFDVDCIPMAMNPFDADIVYLWSRQHECLVSSNLQTQELSIHQESQNWSSNEGCYRVNTSDSKGYMEDDGYATSDIMLSQFVLPPWMDSVPCRPN